MKYDFDRPIDRWNNFAAKYDEWRPASAAGT